ncbi:hypothetical protein [uncultured Succiniclasticum sp.]|uniref:hypothetical protein n=1 Tax=uncultured Succiniclasticum sp. TaxID=1500547 RepID=UPI0025D68E30|nr:hypothetical protein [uncultured Succiniclasticum sp.]
MNLEIAIKEKDNVVKLKITSPDKPLVIELTTNDLGTPVAVATEQNESVSPATEAATTDETLKAETNALAAKLVAMNREYERVKKAAYRAGIRLKENLKALGQTAAISAAGSPGLALAGVPCAVPRVPEACPQGMATVPKGDFAVLGTCPQNVPNSVPGDTWGQWAEDTTYTNTYNINTKSKTTSTMSDPVMSRKETATTNALSPEPVGNCLPFVPENNPHRFIPLANLPEVYQNLLQAWNQLPLRSKLKGLYPDMMEKLHTLLQEFGEATLHKAIRMVADSPFLLGKSSNSSGWVIYFGWLLKPGNLQKILDNKYRNREQEWGQNYYGATCPEYTPWTDTESCYLDPGFMTEGLTTLNEHTRSCLEQAAKLLGLKKENAA